MVIIMQPGAGDAEIQGVVERIQSYGMDAHISRGKERTIIGLIGDEREIDFDSIAALSGVERAIPILKPYKFVSRTSTPPTPLSTSGA